ANYCESAPTISGAVAFDLHTTHGFPFDLTRQMAYEVGLTVDEEEYHRLWQEFTTQVGERAAVQFALELSGPLPETDDRPKWSDMRCEAKLLGWILNNRFVQDHSELSAEVMPFVMAAGKLGLIVDRTCFYAEAGGQVGDRGTVKTDTG